MEFSLIKDMIKRLKHKNTEKTITNGRAGFHIPSGRTLQAVECKRELGLWEINDYMSYILNNYYIDELDYNDLLTFTRDWSNYGTNPQEVENRTRKAVSNLINCLSNSKPISNIDVLWASKRVYVNDIEPDLRRVIIKENNPDELDYKVITQEQDPQVANEIDWLVDLLKYKKHSQGVDKNV